MPKGPGKKLEIERLRQRVLLEIEDFDEGLMTGMILIDLQKAFDTIDHDILLQKLNAIGFSNRTIAWFKSYLSN